MSDDDSSVSASFGEDICIVCRHAACAGIERHDTSWVQCDNCDGWVHTYCVGISSKEANDPEIYSCPRCQIALKEKTQRTLHIGDLVWAKGASQYWPAYIAQPHPPHPDNKLAVVYYQKNGKDTQGYAAEGEMEPLYTESPHNQLDNVELQGLLEDLLPWYRPSNNRAYRQRKKQARIRETYAEDTTDTSHTEERTKKKKQRVPSTTAPAEPPKNEVHSRRTTVGRTRPKSCGTDSHPAKHTVDPQKAAKPVVSHHPTQHASRIVSPLKEKPKKREKAKEQAKEVALRNFRPEECNVRLRLTQLVLHHLTEAGNQLNADHTIFDIFGMFSKNDWRLQLLYLHYRGEDGDRERRALCHWFAEWGQQGDPINAAQRWELMAIVRLLGLRQHYSVKAIGALAYSLSTAANEDPAIFGLPPPDLCKIPAFLSEPSVSIMEAVHAATLPNPAPPPPKPIPQPQYTLPTPKSVEASMVLPSIAAHLLRAEPKEESRPQPLLQFYKAMTTHISTCNASSCTAAILSDFFPIKVEFGPSDVFVWPEPKHTAASPIQDESKADPSVEVTVSLDTTALSGVLDETPE